MPRGAARRILAGTVLVLATNTSAASGWRLAASDVIASQAASAVQTLVALESATELRDQFNADRGSARLILLLSPT
jgi:hypothetical protein